MEIGRRPVETELSRLGAMISHESRAEDQMTLTILCGIAEVIELQAERLRVSLEEHRKLIDDQRIEIDEHQEIVIKGETSWWWLSVIVGALSFACTGAFVYSYALVSDLRDQVHNSESSKKAVDEYISKNKSSDEEISKTIIQVQEELDRINKLKAVKGSK